MDGFNWIYGSKLDGPPEMRCFSLSALQFLDFPEIKDYNVVFLIVKDFEAGKVSSISLENVRLVHPFNAELKTLCIMQCYYPLEFYHFTPLVLSDDNMELLVEVLTKNSPTAYRRRADSEDMCINLDDKPTIDFDQEAPLTAKAYASQFRIETGANIQPNGKKPEQHESSSSAATAASGENAGMAGAGSSAAIAPNDAEGSRGDAATVGVGWDSSSAATVVEAVPTATATTGTAESITESLLSVFESEVEVFIDLKIFWIMYFRLNLLGNFVIREAKTISS